jgi:hypothetical protein
VCRICLGDEENDMLTNPLISPCKCSGTMSTIHVACLIEWLNSKRETRSSATTKSYQWTCLECELCKSKFPDYVIGPNGKRLKLFDYEEPEAGDAPFIVFQSVYQFKIVKTIHVVSTEKRKVTKIVIKLKFIRHLYREERMKLI